MHAVSPFYTPLPVLQAGTISAGNSSATPLAGGATFSGTSADLKNWAGVIVSVYSDKPSANDGLAILFSHDNSTWHTTETFSIQANEVFSASLQPTFRYFKLTYTNGTDAQGTFHLQTQFKTGATLADPFKIMDDVSGQDDASLVKAVLTDRHGHAGEFSVMRDLRVSSPHRLVGATFTGTTVDSTFWTTAVSGAGATATQATNSMTLASGTANSGYAHLQSAKVARFVFAHPNIWRGVVRLASVTAADCTRRWGCFTATAGVPQNGFYFEVSAAGAISLVTCTGATPTPVASGSFNGDFAHYVLDTSVHAYEIHYYLMMIEFFIDGVLIHKISTNTLPALPSADYQLPAAATSMNSAGGTTSGSLQVIASTIMRIGKEETQPAFVYQSGTVAALVLKRGNGVIHSLAISNVSNNATLTLWDNTAGSGTAIYTTGAMAANTIPFSVDLHSVAFYTGLTLTIASANCDVTVIFE